jgi:site-specific DNA-methyltransferase (adenine-specific)
MNKALASQNRIDKWRDRIIKGDCLKVLAEMPDNFVDLIVTSPPYADQRKSTYGGIKPDKYVEWFLPISIEMKRVLKDEGTFVLNIKERVFNCERHTYVLELILALKKQGWLWTEEYIWHKKNSTPGKWSNRFRDNWERLLQFNKQKSFKMYQEAVMVPIGDWAKTRLKKLGKNDVIRFNSQVGSGFGKNIANWVGREMAYPTNVLHMATECSNKNHSASFPKDLPAWFIRLFTQEGDLVLDPFVGSGTSCVAAKELNRHYIGIELKDEYYQVALDNLSKMERVVTQPLNNQRILSQPEQQMPI